MPTVKFIKEKKEIEVPVGTDLRTAAQKAGVNIYDGFNGFGAKLNSLFNCHGFGMCGTCRVNVTQGIKLPSRLPCRIRFHALHILAMKKRCAWPV